MSAKTGKPSKAKKSMEAEILESLPEPPFTLDTTTTTMVVVDNVPVVTQDKLEKLHGVLTKVFSALAGAPREICLPQDAEGMTKGYAFVDFDTPEIAKVALESNGYPLGKLHIFKVNLLSDFERFATVPETYQPPPVKEYRERMDVRSWLRDKLSMEGADQYLIQYADETEILWNDPKTPEKPPSVYRKPHWTESYVKWSPLGTYVATLHQQGVQLWGGESWEKLGRFAHADVKVIDFSPNEKYLLTVTSKEPTASEARTIIIWDLRTQKQVCAFGGSYSAIKEWPVFHWTKDEKYFARLQDGTVHVYDTSTMQLVASIAEKLTGTESFCWSPKDPIIAAYVPDAPNHPARVTVIDVSTGRELRQNSFFDVSDCKMQWHPSGDFLCVKVDRTKATALNAFNIFRLREKNFPVDMFEVKANIVCFAWEPEGNRLALLQYKTQPQKTFLSLYRIEPHPKIDPIRLAIDKKGMDHLYWSPQGHVLIVADMHGKTSAHTIDFFNADTLETMNMAEHTNASSVEWDPTGRFVAVVTSFWRSPAAECGFMLFSASGQLLHQVVRDRFLQFLWRPRPPCLLSTEKLEEIRQNLETIAETYRKREDIDKAAFRETVKQRQARMEEDFAELLEHNFQEYLQEAPKRKALGCIECDSDDDYVEEVVEEIIDEVRTPLSKS
ncbi:eukaryotic translation initiation factor 3B [Pelomyxa schiedti]|nr:eukaryotic translation initiation factor 3B [Pelomyxa schiedti]